MPTPKMSAEEDGYDEAMRVRISLTLDQSVML